MYLVQTFEIVWFSVVIELISSNYKAIEVHLVLPRVAIV